jgi:glycosyltransferase involved in cell wall biosynthesis
MEKYWEQKQKKYAKGLMPVANNYKQKLVMEGVDASKLNVIPCCVELEEFKYKEEQRLAVRKKLNIEDEVTGIYVGKFGGIYYSDEALESFKAAFEYFKNNFKMIILTPDNKSQIRNRLIEIGLDKDSFIVDSIPHSEVPSYLSAADFAFSLYRPSRSKRFLSPIKNGEYWANGLPIIMTKGIGDDSQIIDSEGGGVTFDLEDNNLIKALQKIEVIIQSGSRIEVSKGIRNVALHHRNFDIAREVYNKVYSTLSS